MSRHKNNAQRGAPRGNTEGPKGEQGSSVDRAVNIMLDLEAAGREARAAELLRHAAKLSPAVAAEVAARAASLRAAQAEMREPVATPDLVSRVLDQWEREELVGGPVLHEPQAQHEQQSVFSSGGIGSPAAGTTASQTRHRRLPRRFRAGNWTSAFAILLGAGVTLALAWQLRTMPARVVSTAQAPTPAPVAAVVPHAPATETTRAPSPLRLTNASAYDHISAAAPSLASRPARLRFGDIAPQSARTEPTGAWAFGGLLVPGHEPPASAVSQDEFLQAPALDDLFAGLKLPPRQPRDEARLRLSPASDPPR